MVGAMIGDIAGSRFEFSNYRAKDFELFGDGCFATDDSIMTLAVAQAIMDTRPGEDYLDTLAQNAVREMQRVGRPYPACGYGGRFYDWMYSDDPKPYNSFGNGAAMRISPVIDIARTEAEAKALSRAVTAVTHGHPEGIKGAEATVIAGFMARNGASKDEIRRRISRDYYALDFTIDSIRDGYEFNETCQETVPQAIEAFLESDSFEDSVRTAVSVGGDSDTLAAICGGIAEHFFGVPADLEQAALKYLDARLLGIYKAWREFSSRR